MDVDKAIRTRKSVRRFSDKKPDWRDILKAIDIMRFTPMAGSIFSPRFILVKNKEKIKQIQAACQQDFVGKVDYIVVVVSDEKKTIMSYGEERGKKFSRQQAGAAIQNFLLKLTSMGLATCWVGYFVDDQIKRTLKIPDKAVVEAVFPIGYETKIKTPVKEKPEFDNVMFFDEYNLKLWEPKTRVSRKAD